MLSSCLISNHSPPSVILRLCFAPASAGPMRQELRIESPLLAPILVTLTGFGSYDESFQ